MAKMAAMIVRALRPDDLDALLDINAAGVPGVTPLVPEEIAGLVSGQVRCWVAEAAGSVSGYFIAYHTDTDEFYDGEEFVWFQRHYPSSLYVDQIAVAPAFQRAGIGILLYRIAIDYALGRGCEALVCEVNREPPNPGSLAFHRRLGFEPVGDLRTHDGRTVILLRLPLAAGRTDVHVPGDSPRR
jgi:uncharacterized protein